jgi:hypothetical protein
LSSWIDFDGSLFNEATTRADRAFKAVTNPRNYCRSFRPTAKIGFEGGGSVGCFYQGTEGEGKMTDPDQSPWAGLELDTVIRLRWALRDIKSKRMKMSPVSPEDLRTLLEMGLVEMREDVPVLTGDGDRASWS